jgi:hypothetical protein
VNRVSLLAKHLRLKGVCCQSCKHYTSQLLGTAHEVVGCGKPVVFCC